MPAWLRRDGESGGDNASQAPAFSLTADPDQGSRQTASALSPMIKWFE